MNITEPFFDESELQLVEECLDSKWVTQGPFTARFERDISQYQQLTHAFAVTSCTAALHIAAASLELGPGDEVIVPAFTWVTSANAAEYVGATAVFVDVDPASFNISVAEIEAAITPRTKAIVAVHLFGLSADMNAIRAIADRHDLFVIEDAACAIGSTYKGDPVGEIGDVGCFSFHPRKVITTGEGGLISTRNPELAQVIGALRNHGASGPPKHELTNPMPWTMSQFPYLGFNYRMSDIQAAVGCAQVKKLPTLLADRRSAATRYDELLRDSTDIITPSDPDATNGHSFQSYVIRMADGNKETRNALMLEAKSAGIQTRPGTHAVHRLEYYAKKYKLSADQFPNAVRSEDTTITLPLSPSMSSSDQERVVECIRKFFS